MSTELPYGWKVKKGNRPVVRTLTFRDMKIAVETDKGDVRHWYDPASKEHGETKMHYPYGYFQGTKASGMSGDNMALDVYVGPVEEADDVFVVRQMKRPEFKEFDELKVMVGFESEKQARAAYLMHYNDERFLGEMESYTVDDFKTKYITPFVSKAIPGKDVGMVMMPVPVAAAGAMNGAQVPNPAGMMPGMMPGLGMGMLGPPPIDVETLDGVEALLGRVGGMKDSELLNVVEEIWGPGYQYINATPEHVRCEVLGFLLDQRDLLKFQEEELEALYGIQPMPSSSAMSPSSSTSTGGPQAGVGAPPQGANLQQGASSSPPSPSSSSEVSSLKKPEDPSARTASQMA